MNTTIPDLCRLAANGTTEKILEAIRGGADVDIRDSLGWTPLMYAAKSNPRPEVLLALLNPGADIKAANEHGTPILALAASNENKEVIQTLIKKPGPMLTRGARMVGRR